MSDTRVILGNKEFPVRFSYAHVHEPHAMEEGQDKKYSVAILIDKKDKATISKIKEAFEGAKVLGKTKYGEAFPERKLKDTLHDGDVNKPDNEEYEGMYYLSAKSSTKPGIVDANREEIMENSEFYSGCFGRADVNFYPYIKGTKGVACGLNNLQKLKEGEALSGGGRSASEAFADEDEDDLTG